MEKNQVIIRRSWIGNMLFFVSCSAFVMAGLFVLEEAKFIAIACILFFGIGGLLFIIFMSWKPVVTISEDGITIPRWWDEKFVEWSNVIEIILRKENSTIIIFYDDGTGYTSQKLVINGNEAPALTINYSFSLVKYEKIMLALVKFYDKYKATSYR
jgi:hypothetical protein